MRRRATDAKPIRSSKLEPSRTNDAAPRPAVRHRALCEAALAPPPSLLFLLGSSAPRLDHPGVLQQDPRRVVDVLEPVRPEVDSPEPPTHHHAHVPGVRHVQKVGQPAPGAVLAVVVVVRREREVRRPLGAIGPRGSPRRARTSRPFPRDAIRRHVVRRLGALRVRGDVRDERLGLADAAHGGAQARHERALAVHDRRPAALARRERAVVSPGEGGGGGGGGGGAIVSPVVVVVPGARGEGRCLQRRRREVRREVVSPGRRDVGFRGVVVVVVLGAPLLDQRPESLDEGEHENLPRRVRERLVHGAHRDVVAREGERARGLDLHRGGRAGGVRVQGDHAHRQRGRRGRTVRGEAGGVVLANKRNAYPPSAVGVGGEIVAVDGAERLRLLRVALEVVGALAGVHRRARAHARAAEECSGRAARAFVVIDW